MTITDGLRFESVRLYGPVEMNGVKQVTEISYEVLDRFVLGVDKTYHFYFVKSVDDVINFCYDWEEKPHHYFELD